MGSPIACGRKIEVWPLVTSLMTRDPVSLSLLATNPSVRFKNVELVKQKRLDCKPQLCDVSDVAPSALPMLGCKAQR